MRSRTSGRPDYSLGSCSSLVTFLALLTALSLRVWLAMGVVCIPSIAGKPRMPGFWLPPEGDMWPAVGRAQGNLLRRVQLFTNPYSIFHSLTPSTLCKQEGALAMEGQVSGPALPHTYKPFITSQGISLLLWNGLTVTAHRLTGWRPVLKTKEKNMLKRLLNIRWWSNSEIIEKPGKMLFYSLRTKVSFKKNF